MENCEKQDRIEPGKSHAFGVVAEYLGVLHSDEITVGVYGGHLISPEVWKILNDRLNLILEFDFV